LVKFETKKLETERFETSFVRTGSVETGSFGTAVVGIAAGSNCSVHSWYLNSGSNFNRVLATQTSALGHFLTLTSKRGFDLCRKLKGSSFYLGLGLRILDFAAANFAG